MGILRTSRTIMTTLAGLTISPTVTLRADEVDIAATPEELLESFRNRLGSAEDEILAAEADRLVRRFEGKAGPFPYRTVELVIFHDDGITFDHLSGPFSHCHERFAFERRTTGTRVTHTGTFRLRGGLWTAPLAVTGVRNAFESHVHQHLETLASDMAERSPFPHIEQGLR